jgi:hypothetical protein
MNVPVERRRVARAVVSSDARMRLPVRHRLKLLDISMSGALVGSETPLPVGTHGMFRGTLSGLPFMTELMVNRYARQAGGEAAALGTVFAAMDQRSQQILEQFLKKASE